jgi:hypothetical protein
MASSSSSLLDKSHAHLQNADFVISLTSDSSSSSGVKKVVAAHGTIYHGIDIVHATPGFFSEVLKSDIRKQFDEYDEFGSVIVIRLKDEKIRANVTSLVGHVLETKASTPFSYYNNRRSDFQDPELFAKILGVKKGYEGKPEEKKRQIALLLGEVKSESLESKIETQEKIKKLEFFRAFRGLIRVLNREPISKTKGVSCGNFVSYILKAAIIQKFFPTGPHPDISDAVAAIEKDRRASGKKLDSVAMEKITKFEELVLRLLPSPLTEADRALIQELYRPVKATSVDDFFKKSILANSQLASMGYFFYNGSSSVMTPDLYNAIKSHPEAKKLVLGKEVIKEINRLVGNQPTPKMFQSPSKTSGYSSSSSSPKVESKSSAKK